MTLLGETLKSIKTEHDKRARVDAARGSRCGPGYMLANTGRWMNASKLAELSN